MLNLRIMTWATLMSLAFAVPALAEKTTGEVVDDSTIATETKAALIDKGVKQVHNLVVATH